METSDGVKIALRQETEAQVLKLLRNLQEVKKGDLKGLEQQVMETVFELGRGWMESFLSDADPEESTTEQRVGSCGHRQQLVGYRPKQVFTLMGKITFRRAYYQCVPADGERANAGGAERCTHGEAPADGLWGVQGRRTSAGVQQAVSYLGARLSLEETAETFCRLLPLGMSARQALNLMHPVGAALAQREDEQVSILWKEAAQAHAVPAAESHSSAESETKQAIIERLYIELDGILARLRRGSVPLEEKERQRPGDVYREVKVGAVFPASRGPERSGLAPGVFVDQAGKKRYVARRCKAEEFGKLLYQLALSGGLPQARQLVVLGDGAVWIWRLATEHFPGAVQIVDIWHAREHVWKVARAVFGSHTLQTSIWAEQMCSLLVQGQIEELAAEIAGLPPIPPEPGASRSVPEIELDYFISNAARMRYPAFRAQGMHVGSGIAEAACKTVVSTRAKRAGMRWTPQGLDAVVALRTAVLNETYDDFWEEQPRLVA